VLHLYRDPARLPEKLTVLKQLTRNREDILLQVNRVIEVLKNGFESTLLSIHFQDVMSQIGSGSLPIERLPSSAIVIQGKNKTGERLVLTLEKSLRKASIPVIGRVNDKHLILDLRCLRHDQEEILIQMMRTALQNLITKK
jgi:L-seryl-tRNA(Ser) seleniumtransferase